MRKNRESFFSENNSFSGFNQGMPGMPYMGASSNFYAGPNMGMMPGNVDEISERLAKIERQLSRMDHRLSKLENNVTKTTDEFESTTNNMYIL